MPDAQGEGQGRGSLCIAQVPLKILFGRLPRVLDPVAKGYRIQSEGESNTVRGKGEAGLFRFHSLAYRLRHGVDQFQLGAAELEDEVLGQIVRIDDPT